MQPSKRGKIATAKEAARLVPDGATLVVCGVVGGLVPEMVLKAVGERFDEEGSPRGVDLIFPVAVGDVFGIDGCDHLARPGLLRSVIGGSFVIGRKAATGSRAALVQMILNGEVPAWNFPIGALMNVMRRAAAGERGHLTRIGVGTFVDPRHGGGKLNDAAKEDLVEVVEVGGEELLYYRLPRPGVAILRGTTADEWGNVSMEKEGLTSGVLAYAQAVHNADGTVIVQVERVARGGTLNPQLVRIPGVLVDAVVVDAEQVQGTGFRYDPATTGETRAALELEPITPSANTVIARRALQELRAGDACILGFGAPTVIPQLVAPHAAGPIFTIEHGAIGGTPLGGFGFGISANPWAIVDGCSHFDFIEGGGVDVACLGFGDVDRAGRINVSLLGDLIPGTGGFIDITWSAQTVVFCGTLTTGGLDARVENGRLRIEREGKVRRFHETIAHVDFDPAAGAARGQRALLVTERAVFRLEREGPMLVEVAPGFVPSQIIELMGFEPRVADELVVTDESLYA